MIVRFLIGLVLLELAVMGLVISCREVFDLQSAAYWQRQAWSAEFERETCDTKHKLLVKQIRKEGLYARLALGGQPWLQ